MRGIDFARRDSTLRAYLFFLTIIGFALAIAMLIAGRIFKSGLGGFFEQYYIGDVARINFLGLFMVFLGVALPGLGFVGFGLMIRFLADRECLRLGVREKVFMRRTFLIKYHENSTVLTYVVVSFLFVVLGLICHFLSPTIFAASLESNGEFVSPGWGMVASLIISLLTGLIFAGVQAYYFISYKNVIELGE